LFEALKVAPDDDSAKYVENRIWAIWLGSPSDTANLLMGRVKTAVDGKDLDLAIKLLDAVIDLPFAISPVVIGLALILVYGQAGWLGGWLADHGVQVIFSLPGMVLATVFVSLPYVVREVVPVLREVGTDQEEAAWTLGASPLRAFLQVTLPAIRWGVAYGVVLTTARALGEFGAVTIVSGRLAGQTETLTLYVENRFEAFDLTGAYAASLTLALLALLVLLAMTRLQRKEGR
jgi:sulfate transport system permease protein